SNLDQRRRLGFERPQDATAFGAVTDTTDNGSQSYHAMLVSIQRTVSRGATVSTNYTWSHCTSTSWDARVSSTPEVNDNLGIRYATDNRISGYGTNWVLAHGDCPADHRQVFNVTAVADSPQFTKPMLRIVGSGWRLAGIYKKATGESLTILSG